MMSKRRPTFSQSFVLLTRISGIMNKMADSSIVDNGNLKSTSSPFKAILIGPLVTHGLNFHLDEGELCHQWAGVN